MGRGVFGKDEDENDCLVMLFSYIIIDWLFLELFFSVNFYVFNVKYDLFFIFLFRLCDILLWVYCKIINLGVVISFFGRKCLGKIMR